MPLTLEHADETFLKSNVEKGEVIIVLGAGASRSSKNNRGAKIKLSDELAASFAAEAGLDYSNDSLQDVLAAIVGDNILSNVRINKHLESEFKGSSPSPDLENLFKFTWKRLYTWNIDDCLENLKERKQQVIRYYNGMSDKAVDFESERFLHVIYLHGQVTKSDSGFILTEIDYTKAINSGSHHWYGRLGQDYIASCPVIIGSALNEPILASEVERASRAENSNSGRAFLITPDKLTAIRKRALRSKGIVHIEGTLGDFVGWLRVHFPKEITPKDVLGIREAYSSATLNKLDREDIDVAHYLRPQKPQDLRDAVSRITTATINEIGKNFLMGFAPTWIIAASDIPVRLQASDALYRAIKDSQKNNDHLFVTIGQAGSGKTTATMQAAIQFLSENPKIPLYEMSGDTKSPRRAFQLLRKLHDGPCLVYVRDIHVFGDSFSEDLDYLSGSEIMVISTARTGEWKEHLTRYIGQKATTFTFERFSSNDFDPIIDKIVKFVPSPLFRKMNRNDQRSRLRASRNQLLIALREVTESGNFSKVITDEYTNLPDDDSRALLLIVAIATIARVGIAPEMAKDVYSRLTKARPFERAIDVLSGIISEHENGRIFARHEIYVRHLIERSISFEQIRSVIIEILRNFVRYNIPVIKSVKRLDANLFRFVLNHNFIQEHERRAGAPGQGRLIFKTFELEFQLDGHFWLQYGLYLAGLGELSDARDMLRRSIDAYPSNAYAVHAFADLTLKMAASSVVFDSDTRAMVDQAVAVLREQDAKSLDDVDQYPIVTLSVGHISVLVKHGLREEAKRVAPSYFDRLQQVERQVDAAAVKKAKERVFRFVTLDEWQQVRQKPQGLRPKDNRRNRGAKHRSG